MVGCQIFVQYIGMYVLKVFILVVAIVSVLYHWGHIQSIELEFVHWIHSYIKWSYNHFEFYFQSYKNKSKLFSPSISASDDVQSLSSGNLTANNSGTVSTSGGPVLGPSLSVGGLQSSGGGPAPSLANLHSNSCGSPSFTKDLGNSTDGSLKVTKSGKPINRWSGLWGSSSKVSWCCQLLSAVFTGCPRKIDTERNISVLAICRNVTKTYTRWMLL